MSDEEASSDTYMRLREMKPSLLLPVDLDVTSDGNETTFSTYTHERQPLLRSSSSTCTLDMPSGLDCSPSLLHRRLEIPKFPDIFKGHRVNTNGGFLNGVGDVKKTPIDASLKTSLSDSNGVQSYSPLSRNHNDFGSKLAPNRPSQVEHVVGTANESFHTPTTCTTNTATMSTIRVRPSVLPTSTRPLTTSKENPAKPLPERNQPSFHQQPPFALETSQPHESGSSFPSQHQHFADVGQILNVVQKAFRPASRSRHQPFTGVDTGLTPVSLNQTSDEADSSSSAHSKFDNLADVANVLMAVDAFYKTLSSSKSNPVNQSSPFSPSLSRPPLLSTRPTIPPPYIDVLTSDMSTDLVHEAEQFLPFEAASSKHLGGSTLPPQPPRQCQSFPTHPTTPVPQLSFKEPVMPTLHSAPKIPDYLPSKTHPEHPLDPKSTFDMVDSHNPSPPPRSPATLATAFPTFSALPPPLPPPQPSQLQPFPSSPIIKPEHIVPTFTSKPPSPPEHVSHPLAAQPPPSSTKPKHTAPTLPTLPRLVPLPEPATHKTDPANSPIPPSGDGLPPLPKLGNITSPILFKEHAPSEDIFTKPLERGTSPASLRETPSHTEDAAPPTSSGLDKPGVAASETLRSPFDMGLRGPVGEMNRMKTKLGQRPRWANGVVGNVLNGTLFSTTITQLSVVINHFDQSGKLGIPILVLIGISILLQIITGCVLVYLTINHSTYSRPKRVQRFTKASALLAFILFLINIAIDVFYVQLV